MTGRRPYYLLLWRQNDLPDQQGLELHDQDEALRLFANMAGRPVVVTAMLHYYENGERELVASF